MKLGLVLVAAAMAGVLPVAAANAGQNDVTTHMKNGGNSATIVQSGDPKSAQVRIEQHPGYTRIEQHSNNNSATVIQMDAAPGRN